MVSDERRLSSRSSTATSVSSDFSFAMSALKSFSSLRFCSAILSRFSSYSAILACADFIFSAAASWRSSLFDSHSDSLPSSALYSSSL